jgi:hypothetical protein
MECSEMLRVVFGVCWREAAAGLRVSLTGNRFMDGIVRKQAPGPKRNGSSPNYVNL